MKIIKIAVLFLMLSLLSCEKNSVSKPEDVGKKVFEVLKRIDKKTISDYNIQVITYNDFEDLRNNPNTKLGDYRNELKSYTAEKFKKMTISNFKGIKTDGTHFKIDWKKIIFLNFEVQNFEFGYPNGLLGKTYFKNSDGKEYFVKSMSFYDGKGFKTIAVGQLERKGSTKVRWIN
jgi:hypothetical protein